MRASSCGTSFLFIRMKQETRSQTGSTTPVRDEQVKRFSSSSLTYYGPLASWPLATMLPLRHIALQILYL
ncbi:hypothetical protein BK647_11680 [Pseudomonas protegens]|nr:hypothetical protein BBH58_22545 [Pseudomonas protegens]OBZ30112.1 hypothetical protein BBH57_09540 [Pseudomonas protegens]ROM45130.1 hypothetical protein BK647_11680 [Pseudomonas protegens]